MTDNAGKHAGAETPLRLHPRFLYRVTQMFVRIGFILLFGLRVRGRENVPARGAFIIASNHQSWFDPPLVGSTCPREVYYAAKQELFTTPIFGSLIRYYNTLPVHRSGYDRRVLNLLSQALDAGNGITIFPEGTRFLDGRLHKPKPGVGILAVKHNPIIVPVYINGTARLPSQIFRRGVRIRFGKPFRIDPDELEAATDKERYRSAADIIMTHIAETGGVPGPDASDRNATSDGPSAR